MNYVVLRTLLVSLEKSVKPIEELIDALTTCFPSGKQVIDPTLARHLGFVLIKLTINLVDVDP